MRSVELVSEWPVDNASVAVVRADGSLAGQYGDQRRSYRLASVTKLLSAYAALIAVEEGALELSDPAGPEGATVRHLLAHTSGLAFDSDKVQAQPATRRIYSNTGFAVLAETVAAATEMDFAEYLRQAVFEPLGMSDSRLDGHPGSGAVSTCADLTVFAAELQRPTLLDPTTVESATGVAFGGLDGVLPGLGMQKPNDWGLGFEIRDGKNPHWTGAGSSPQTFGHFGQSGTFVWVDPSVRAACIALTDRDFGDWAKTTWPEFTDAVLNEL